MAKNTFCEWLNTILDSTKVNRNAYMGIAIILVILYHAQGFIPDFPILKLFLFGSIGVDVFLFLSGLGLSYSLTNHSTRKFYIRRFLRVFPLFLIFALVKTAYIVNFEDIHLSFTDWICNLTTLSYYNLGGTFIDWYICALVLLYILFPILYRITNIYSIIFITISIALCYFVFGRPYWTYDCLLGRIPIFLAGILAYKSPQKLWLVVLLFWGLLPVSAYMWLSTPFLNTLFVTLLFPCCYIFLKLCRDFSIIRNLLEFTGKYSLELYLGNCAAMMLKINDLCVGGGKLPLYFVLTILFGIFFYGINILFQRLIANMQNVRNK